MALTHTQGVHKVPPYPHLMALRAVQFPFFSLQSFSRSERCLAIVGEGLGECGGQRSTASSRRHCNLQQRRADYNCRCGSFYSRGGYAEGQAHNSKRNCQGESDAFYWAIVYVPQGTTLMQFKFQQVQLLQGCMSLISSV